MTATLPRVVCLPLPATKTWKRRRVVWVPDEGERNDARQGTARITQCVKANRNSDADDFASYGVQEVLDAPAAWREFLFLHDDDATQEQPYRVILARAGATCTCRAGITGTPVCKHRDAIAAILSEGLL